MYALARRWLPPPDALFAAAFYALNPYHLLIIYWRSAYAELLAAMIVPFDGAASAADFGMADCGRFCGSA